MKYLFYVLMLMSLITCSRENEGVNSEINNEIKPNYTISRFKVLEISSNVQNPQAKITWKIDGKTYSNDSVLEFISAEIKRYNVTLEIENAGEISRKNFTIQVEKEAKEYSKYISQVLEYRPAVGQFVNEIPLYENGDTPQKMLEKAKQIIVGENTDKKLLTLGGYGGYVVFGFDHTIPNLEGRDFKVLGNAFAGSSEPGVIMVAYDRNKNGKPDDNEWFEIAGSEYSKNETIKNYSITYFKPDENNPANQYLKWQDNQGNTGYKVKNIYHKQSYYPLWISENNLIFAGTKLADNYTQNGSIWYGNAPAYGYADVSADGDSIDISWAVDSLGQPVKLVGIDFVKIYTGINQEAGWLGEISTEIIRAENLYF